MPTHNALHGTYVGKYPAPRKYVLVLSCMDARLLDDLVCFLDHDNLTNRYYHLTFPGTSLGLTKRVDDDLDDPKHPPAHFVQWRQTFIDSFQAAVLLSDGKITDVYIVQHEDCGAFREYLGIDSAEMTHKQEVKLHKDYSDALLQDIVENFCTKYNPFGKYDPLRRVQEKVPLVHTFYMDLRGGVTRLNSWPKKGDKPSACDNYGCQCKKTPAEQYEESVKVTKPKS